MQFKYHVPKTLISEILWFLEVKKTVKYVGTAIMPLTQNGKITKILKTKKNAYW